MISEERKAAIAATRKFAEKILQVCDDIQNGKSEAGSCREQDVDVVTFRRMAANAEKKYVDPVPAQSSEPRRYIGDEERFLCDLYQSSYAEVLADFDQAYQAVCATLRELDADVLTRYYFDGYTCKEIAMYYEMTEAHIRSIIRSNMKKIRTSDRIRYFTDGCEYTTRQIELKEKISVHKDELIWMNAISKKFDQFEEEKKKKITELNLSDEVKTKLLNRDYTLIENLFAVDVEQVVTTYCREYVSNGSLGADITPLKDLELSARTYNALIRHGVECMEDLLEKSIEELKNIRNLGESSLNEIKREVEKRGHSLRENRNRTPYPRYWTK